MAAEGPKPEMSAFIPGQMSTEQMRQVMSMTYKYRGVNFQPMLIPVENLKAMETFQVRNDDIFVLTYPKCGTHWTMEIVYLILADGYPEKINRSEKMKFGALEMTMPTMPVPGYKMAEDLPSPRVFPTHLPENILPPQIFQNKGKVVFVTRNPKDCVTSLHRFLTGSNPNAKDNWSEVFDQFLTDEMLNGSWFDFNLSYWKHRHDSNFLVLKYEDMKRDTKSAVIAIADHIGRVLSDEAIDRVVENCSMSAMKKSYKKADEEKVMLFQPGQKENLVKFLRKGTVGDWKNALTVAQNERMDEVYFQKMAGSGLKFEYE
ncbi:amine sulfotransferase-like [Asterias amurensis]|uniref:amine sulfotransferase-like n=1 Tax=Asterias amurensis TaxID=7602 RepID=UPI003AB6EB08